MGSKQSKNEGDYIPSTPITQCNSLPLINMNTDSDNSLDPRSPSGCRTPIFLSNSRIDTDVQLAPVVVPDRDCNRNALDVLRKRFFKSFTYSINDPRSPSVNFNRTPLVFEDNPEKSLCLDDTFADLFVESHLPNTLNKIGQSEETADSKHQQDEDVEMKDEKVTIDLEEPTTDPKTPVATQQEYDPRSPSIGVERTPIIFTDDEVDESNEDLMLENILATLSLNLNTSGNSSVVSMTPENVSVNFNNKIDQQFITKPMNKHLDRVRGGKKILKNRKPNRRPSQQQIYEDRENHMPMTPKLKEFYGEKNDSLKGKRTPLSSVRNHNGSHFRSRSVELSSKSIKTQLSVTNFDDTLNFAEHTVSNLRIVQQESHDSIEM